MNKNVYTESIYVLLYLSVCFRAVIFKYTQVSVIQVCSDRTYVLYKENIYVEPVIHCIFFLGGRGGFQKRAQLRMFNLTNWSDISTSEMVMNKSPPMLFSAGAHAIPWEFCDASKPPV